MSAMEDFYRPPQTDPTPDFGAPGGSQMSYTVKPHGLTTFVVTMLWIGLGMDVVLILSDFGQFSLLSRPDYTDAEAIANDSRQQLVGIGVMAVYVITAIPFLMWIYRANVNVRGFGANIPTSPGWSVGWYFIPVANWFKPFQAMKEIWLASIDPHRWSTQSGSPILGWWWAMWISSNFLGQIVWRFPGETIEDLQAGTVVSMVAGFLDIILILLAIKLLKTIIRNQDQLVGKRASVY